MQNRNLLALAIFSGLLTACGGGDDDSNNPADPKNNPPPLQGPSPGLQYQHRIDPIDQDGSFGIIDSNGNGNSNNNNGSNSGNNNNNSGNNNGGNNNNSGNNNNPGNNNGGNNGNNGGNNNGNNNGGNNNSKSYNQISINNKTIDLLPSNIAPGAGGFYTNEDAQYKKLIGNHLQFALYGVIVDKGAGNARAFFKESGPMNVTMPTTGMVRYQGSATHYDVAKNELSQGTSGFDVNFDAHTVNGQINISGKSPITLSADISGQRFSGTTADKVATDGHFYGNRGEEISGAYGKNSANNPNEKEFIGAFGARER